MTYWNGTGPAGGERCFSLTPNRLYIVGLYSILEWFDL